jgi:hypothetical protein
MRKDSNFKQRRELSAKRVFGIPDLKYYALGDGLYNIFSCYPGQLIKTTVIKELQLNFGFG